MISHAKIGLAFFIVVYRRCCFGSLCSCFPCSGWLGCIRYSSRSCLVSSNLVVSADVAGIAVVDIIVAEKIFDSLAVVV